MTPHHPHSRRKAAEGFRRVLELASIDAEDFGMACMGLAVACADKLGDAGDVIQGRRYFELGHTAILRNRYLYGSDTNFPALPGMGGGQGMPPLVQTAYDLYAPGGAGGGGQSGLDWKAVRRMGTAQDSGLGDAVAAIRREAKGAKRTKGAKGGGKKGGKGGSPQQQQQQQQQQQHLQRGRQMCEHCGKTDEAAGKKLLQCSKCKAVSYCSLECQKAAWANHKGPCKLLTKSRADREAAMAATAAGGGAGGAAGGAGGGAGGGADGGSSDDSGGDANADSSGSDVGGPVD